MAQKRKKEIKFPVGITIIALLILFNVIVSLISPFATSKPSNILQIISVTMTILILLCIGILIRKDWARILSIAILVGGIIYQLYTYKIEIPYFVSIIISIIVIWYLLFNKKIKEVFKK